MDARPTPASDAAALAALLVGACVGAGVAHAAFSSEKRRDGDGGVSRHSISSAIASSLFAPLRWMATTLPTSSSTNTTTTLPPPRESVLDMIGNTPMQRVESLSRLTGCDVLIKCEFANPGGSVKDRVALRIVREALASGELRPGGEITEGTAGSTGVSVALVAAALGCKAHLVLPDDAAVEKPQMMASFGATTRRVRPVSISHPEHYVKIARQRAMDACARDGKGAGYFANQFENAANFRAHLDGTGPEIWRQMGGRRGGVDAFVCAAGTGGTLAGVSRYLRSKDPRVQFFLVDPPGSSLYNKVNRGVMYCKEEAEGTRLKNPFDTITEGVGINRLTANFSIALGGDGSEAGTSAPVEGVEPLETSPIARAFKCSDREAVEMSRYLAREDGLFLGSSSCVNVVGAVKVARALGPGHRVVTIACDSGVRHLTKFWSPEYLEKHGLTPRATGSGLEFLDREPDDPEFAGGAEAEADVDAGAGDEADAGRDDEILR